MTSDQRRAYQREWVEKNHQKKLDYQKAYRARAKAKDSAFLEKEREYAKDYRSRNRERVNAKERARKKGLSQVARREYFRVYRRGHPLTPTQMERRRKAQQRWRDRNRVEFNRKRRERYAGRVREDVYIPVSSTRMEVEAEMWIATAEGRDPQKARRDFFSREAGWSAKTILLRSPHSDGPMYEEKIA